MKSVGIFTALILLIYVATLWLKVDDSKIGFLDKRHTGMLRGIAILAVIWGHATKALGIDHIQVVAEIGVWIFLFCSGYGCYKSFQANRLEHFWKKRFTKVIIPFWCCEFVGLLITGRFEIQNFLWDMSFIRPATSYGWFMGFIILYYIAFWIIGKLCKSDKAFSTALLVFSAIVFVYFSTVSVNPLFPALKARQVMAFPIGVLIAQHTDAAVRLINKNKRILPIGITSAILVGGGMKLITKWLQSRTPYLVSNITALISVTLVSTGVIVLSHVILSGKVNRIINNQFFIRLGEFSFALYMVHAFTLDLLNGGTIRTVLFILVTCVIAYVVHMIFNRWFPQLFRRKTDG